MRRQLKAKAQIMGHLEGQLTHGEPNWPIPFCFLTAPTFQSATSTRVVSAIPHLPLLSDWAVHIRCLRQIGCFGGSENEPMPTACSPIFFPYLQHHHTTSTERPEKIQHSWTFSRHLMRKRNWWLCLGLMFKRLAACRAGDRRRGHYYIMSTQGEA